MNALHISIRLIRDMIRHRPMDADRSEKSGRFFVGGNMRSIDRSFYNRTQWIECKNEYLRSVNHLCERCLKSGQMIPADIVHHKVHMNEHTVTDPALAYGFENLEALCIKCHNKEHFGSSEKKRYQFVGGQLVIDTRGE